MSFDQQKIPHFADLFMKIFLSRLVENQSFVSNFMSIRRKSESQARVILTWMAHMAYLQIYWY